MTERTKHDDREEAEQWQRGGRMTERMKHDGREDEEWWVIQQEGVTVDEIQWQKGRDNWEERVQGLRGRTRNRTMEGTQQQEQQRRKKGNIAGRNHADRRMLVVASHWCMAKPSQDVCPWDAATVKTREG